MKTQHLTLTDSLSNLRFQTERRRLALCKEVANMLLNDSGSSELNGAGNVVVSFNRRPFKGARKIFLKVQRQACRAYDGIRYGWDRGNPEVCCIYEQAIDTLLPFFPKDGVFPLYLKAIKH